MFSFQKSNLLSNIMLKSGLAYTDSIYETIRAFWESRTSSYLTSAVLVVSFSTCSLLSILVYNDYIKLGSWTAYFENPFASIEIVFTLLLITELFSLIFVLPESVARSVGKQFELLSLIFLRDGFKEFSHLKGNFSWENLKNPLTNMVIYSFGAILIFSIIGLVYKLQKHIKLTNTEDEQAQFGSFKKLLALLLLGAFGAVGFIDLKTLFTTGYYLNSFQMFYTVLIFSDIMIVLIALRYTLNYYKIFRYSAFVLATLLLRIALSAQTYYDVLVGIVAALFILMLTLAYNYFLEDSRK